MAEVSKNKQQEIKNEIRQGIIERLLGNKIDTINEEIPIRSSFQKRNLADYSIIDTHYQALKNEILHELGEYLLQNKSDNEKNEVPIRAGYVNHAPEDTWILEGHYQKLKDEICHEIVQQLADDKVITEKDAMAIHASYLHELQEQGNMSEAIAKRLLAKGMSEADVAEAMQLPQDTVARLKEK